uniref:Pleckstrin homology domain containing, family B (evectins) member 2 n=1 Tax=Sander lucioperca TaxID=283035 RepID=A0A8C9XQH2_SANLU
MAMVKSGWLHRQSTILHRWKRNWFDLWVDGWLVFYNNQQRRDMEDDIDMRDDCIDIRNFYACQELNPPEGKMRDAFLQIVCGRYTSDRLCTRSDSIWSSQVYFIHKNGNCSAHTHLNAHKKRA